MSELVSLAEQRAIRENDSTLWTPTDALRAMLRDIESGEIKPTQMAVHYFEDGPDGKRAKHHYCVVNLTRDEHIVLLNVALRRAIDGLVGLEP